jgi:ribosomal protein L30/L7E
MMCLFCFNLMCCRFALHVRNKLVMLRRLSTPLAACALSLAASVRRCSTSSSASAVPQHSVAHPPHRTVGGVFLVYCVDHPFKYTWEITKMLRDLRLEFRGQLTIHPDIPAVRKLLWRTRQVVRIERLDLDEAKVLVGIPSHMQFRDLAKQIPRTFGRTRGSSNPILRSRMNFMQYRRMRIRDLLHRDAVEKKLLAAKKVASQPKAGHS